MNFSEIQNAVRHLIKTSKCTQCKGRYTHETINVIAATKNEGLFELKCLKCKTSTIVTVLITPPAPEKTMMTNRKHQKISQNDVLDIKNFLSGFDGNFKKIFSPKDQ